MRQLKVLSAFDDIGETNKLNNIVIIKKSILLLNSRAVTQAVDRIMKNTTRFLLLLKLSIPY